MSSFFGKLKSNAETKATASGSTTKQKIDPNAPQPTPLERMLEHAGPIRNDGSDKFFGMENFGNTCYCNSVLQALYYSVPFRENVLSYPHRSTPESLAAAAATATPRPKPNPANNAPKPGQPQVIRVTPAQQPGQPKPDDKDSPEYKKKQALLAGPILNMSYQNANSYSMPESLYSALKDIFEAVSANQSRHGVISPTKLVEVLRRDNEMFRGQTHQDAHEFFNLLLNTILDNIEDNEKKIHAATPAQDTAPTANGSLTKPEPKAETSVVSFPSFLPTALPSHTKWLRDMFEGTLTSETRCLTCENVSQRDEPFLDLSVDLEQHSSVTSCLRRFSEEEMLCERNKFHCDNCGGLQEAEKRMKIKRLPRVLALHLKRFKYTEDFGRLQKLFHKVVYPYHLRLFNTTDDAEDPDRIYELYAVVVHIGGGPFHGHYVAVIKTQDRGWLLFDDEMVEPVDRSYVQNFFGDKPGLATAYVLFYQETTIEAIRAEQRREGRRRASQDIVRPTAVAKDSVEMHRVQSQDPPLSPHEINAMPNLDHAFTAPAIHTNGHLDRPQSPLSPGVFPSSPVIHSKKERAKEEKERKVAEKLAQKEKERADKEKRKDLTSRLAETARQNADQLKAAMDESKKGAKTEDELRNGANGVYKEPVATNGVSGLDRFKRSKSLRFGSMGRKDKVQNSHEENVIDETPEKDHDKEATKEKEKRNRFSIRKKSFGLLT